MISALETSVSQIPGATARRSLMDLLPSCFLISPIITPNGLQISDQMLPVEFPIHAFVTP